MTAPTETPVPADSVAGAGALRRVLDGRWHEVRDSARALAVEGAFRSGTGLDVESHRAQVLDQLQMLADSEHPRRGFPSRFGGLDDVGGAVTSFEMLAFGDLSLLVKAGVQWGLFGGAVLHLGTERHHERYLPAIMSLDLTGCFAMTETGHGSDVQSVRTTATFDPDADEFVLHTPDGDARKDYIGNAARDGRVAAVFAQLVTGGRSHGVHAFLVPIRGADGRPSPGVSIEDCGHKAGLNGVDNGRLSFDDVRVPRDALLDRYGQVAADGTYSSPIENETKRFFTMLGTLVQGRVSVAGGAGSAAKTALVLAVRYGERRRQFKVPGTDEEVVLLDYLAHQRKLLPALARSYAMHFAQSELVERLHEVFTGEPEATEDADRRELETRAAGVKAAATWHATATIQLCREACGGAGYLSENRLPGLKADSDVFTTFEGDNTVLLQLVARGLLTSYRDHFGELDTLGTVRFVANQVVETVVERSLLGQALRRARSWSPRSSRGADSRSPLTDRAAQQELFAWRERHVLGGLARRLRRVGSGGTQGREAFEGFNATQDHLVLAARAHVDRLVVDAFAAAVDRCTDPGARALLSRLCDLHVLATIEQERAWFLEHGRLTPRQGKEVTAAVNALCRELRPHAGALVDAFGVPEPVLDVPMLRD
jgi:acyl-CoA oxidase